MKANEAPEKIYLYPYPTDGIYEVETKPLEGTIEYIRADVFIEKACDYLMEIADRKKRVELFKKHMEGK